MGDQASVRITLLGAVAVEGPLGRARPKGVQPTLLLAALALARPRPLTRDELVDLLWPDERPSHWAGAARHVVSRTRTALVDAGLAADCLTSSGGLVVADLGDPEVDVTDALAELAAAEEHLALGRSGPAAAAARAAADVLTAPFLPGVEALWVDGWRLRLDAARRRALQVLAAAALGDGRPSDALAAAQRLLGEDPFDEAATRVVIEAQLALGNRSAALAAYEACRAALDRELGVRPSPDTDEVWRRALGADDHGPGRERPSRRPDDARVRPDRPARFVGREAEAAALAGAWATVVAERRLEVVVIEGEAGIGKTRLATELAGSVGSTAAVLWGGCRPAGGSALQPFDQIAAALGRAERPSDTGPAGLAAADDERARAQRFGLVADGVTEVAEERPALLVLEDLHWIGADGVDLLAEVVEAVRRRPCLVVLTLRRADGALADVLAELGLRVPVRTLRPTGLAVGDVVRLVEDVGAVPAAEVAAVADTVVRRTAGNPLYVTQLLREAGPGGLPFDPEAIPAAVADLVTRRMAALDRREASLLALAAVMGTDVEVKVLERCSSLPSPAEVLDGLEALERLRFLEEQGPERFRFVHELVRDAVVGTVSATRQVALHRAVADALVEVSGSPARIAHHYGQAGAASAAPALEWQVRAGQEALDHAAWAAAAEHLEPAAAAADRHLRCQALVGLGRARRALGDPAGARRALDQARALARAAGLGPELAAATLALVGGGGRGVALDLPDGERAALLREAIAAVDEERPDLLVPLLDELALALVLADEVDERRALTDRAIAVARRWGDPSGVAHALLGRRVALMGPAGTEARAADAADVLLFGEDEIRPEVRLATHLDLVEDRLELGDRAGAAADLAAARALAEELGHPYWSWAAGCWTALDACIDGRLDEAEALAVEAFGHQAVGDHPEALAALGVLTVDIRLFQGRSAEVLDLLEGAADENPQIPAYRAVLALSAAEAGEHDRARRAIDALGSVAALPPDSNWLLAVAVLGDAAAAVGRLEVAAEVRTVLEPWAGRHVVLNCYGGGGAYWGPVTDHLGRLAAAAGEVDEARSLLATAADEAERFGAPCYAARSRAARAALHPSGVRAPADA